MTVRHVVTRLLSYVCNIQTPPYCSPFVSFDVLFTITTLAEAHVNHACDLVHPGTDAEGRVEAGRLLRAASGMFTYAAETLVPMIRKRSGGKMPLEATVPVLIAMAHVCLAQVSGGL